MKCEGCGAELAELVVQCGYCGRRLLQLASFDEEAITLLRTLEDRLGAETTRRTDAQLFAAFFAWVATGPAAFVLLGQFTDVGFWGRAAAALLLMAPGFLLFGFFILNRQQRAEAQVWRESVGRELDEFAARKGISGAEMLVLSKRLLGDEARLVLRLARGEPADD